MVNEDTRNVEYIEPTHLKIARSTQASQQSAETWVKMGDPLPVGSICCPDLWISVPEKRLESQV